MMVSASASHMALAAAVGRPSTLALRTAHSAAKGKAKAVVALTPHLGAAPMTSPRLPRPIPTLRPPSWAPSPRFVSTSSAATVPAAASANTASTSASSSALASAASASTSPSSSSSPPSHPPTSTPAARPPPSTLSDAVALLRSQPSLYALASIVGRTYLVTASDVVTLPRLRDVEVGDVLLLDRVHEVGSRRYTLRAQSRLACRPSAWKRTGSTGQPSTSASPASGYEVKLLGRLEERTGELVLERRLHEVREGQGEAEVGSGGTTMTAPATPLPLRLDTTSWTSRLLPQGLAHVGAVLPSSHARVRCVVVEQTRGKTEVIVKEKRRKGYRKTVRHAQTYTRLRVEAIEVGEA